MPAAQTPRASKVAQSIMILTLFQLGAEGSRRREAWVYKCGREYNGKRKKEKYRKRKGRFFHWIFSSNFLRKIIIPAAGSLDPNV
jgi:hypothetical protein